jgi:hypothetical protein
MTAPHPEGGALLTALRWAWDGLYVLTGTGSGIHIARAADGGSWTASDPLSARDEILADYGHRPAWPPRAAGGLSARIAFEMAHPEVTWSPPSTFHRVTWTSPDGTRQEVASPTSDGALMRLRDHGFTVPVPDPADVP